MGEQQRKEGKCPGFDPLSHQLPMIRAVHLEDVGDSRPGESVRNAGPPKGICAKWSEMPR